MFKDTISYVDFNGNAQSQDVYFNLSKNELMEIQFSIDEGYDVYLTKALEGGNKAKLYSAMVHLIDKAYGIKSEDGQRFIKSPELIAEFKETPIYDVLMTKILTDDNYFNTFVTGMMPSDLDVFKNSSNIPNEKKEIVEKFKAFESGRAEA